MLEALQPVLLLSLLLSTGWALSDCDPLVPEYCMLPFPNNFYLRPANSSNSRTGFQLNITPTSLPLSNDGKRIDPADWLERDGFARLVPIATYVEGISLEASKLPRNWDIGASLGAGASSVLVDAETGELLPHWAEIDTRQPVAPIEQRMLLLWPTKALNFGTRYVVGLRNFRNVAGGEIQPSQAFIHLRDRIPSDNSDIEERREHFEESIFPLLEKSGFPRQDLYLAWDFTVSSEDNTRKALFSMKQDSLSRIPASGPRFRILQVQDDYSPNTGRYIFGQFQTPSYRERNQPGSKLVMNQDQIPQYQEMVWAPFSLTIPASVTSGAVEPQGVVNFGHGLFQNHLVLLVDELQAASNKGAVVMYATNMVGMCAEDIPAIYEMLNNDLSNAAIIPHGSLQGVINHLVLTKLILSEDFANNVNLMVNNRTSINTESIGYIGYSQGGIYGSTILGASDDINLGVLGVPGAPFVLLLPRADPFIPYWEVICNRYDNSADRLQLLSYLQILWDLVDPIGWVDYTASLPGKKLQFVWAKGDAQVTYLGHDVLARGAGARLFPNVVTARANETVFGIPVADSDFLTTGHVAIGYDFGVPEVPIYNIPPNKDTDTHNDVYGQQTFVDRSLRLFFEGIHYQMCKGPCGFDPK